MWKGDEMKRAFGSVAHIGDCLDWEQTGTQRFRRSEQVFKKQQKQNIKRIVVASILIYAILVPVLLVGNYLQYFQMTRTEQIVCSLGMSFEGIFFFMSASKIIKKENWKWQQLFNQLFWGTIWATLLYLGCQTGITTVSLILFFVMVLALGGVPYLEAKERILYGVLLSVSLIILCRRHNMAWEELCCGASWGMLGLWLSWLRCKEFVRECVQGEALKNALLEAETDPMTKLMNRRGLERRLQAVLSGGMCKHKQIAVIMIDIDNFKLYNDTFGHCMGDECIKAVAREVHKNTKRLSGLSSRVGGEEFLVFLNDVNKEEVLQWAKELQACVMGRAITQSEKNFLPIVTISVGIHFEKLGKWEEFSSFCDIADGELYHAKKQGKNCISMDGICYYHEKEQEYRRKAVLVRKHA